MDRTFLKRALLLVLCVLFVGSLLTLGIAATEQATELEVTVQASKNPTNEELGGFFSAQRIEYAITVTLQGMLMIFAVLALLWGVVAIFKVVLHDIPEKRAAKKQALSAAVAEAAAPAEQPAEIAPIADEDEGEIVAAITAAIAVMLQSEEYKGQFESGFRVVSFTRKGGAWNKEN
ncbi:MAG: OadG family protein [Clostridia bacterium]|nr:OadG family protein [Clostridia bacterium]